MQPTPPAPPRHLLYLHGFRSSPKSFKAQLVEHWLRQHRPDVQWWCPQLPPSPRAAMQLIDDGIAGWPAETMAVIGSSLGGFYATIVAERRGCRAVLLNPAVDPARDLAGRVGEQAAWHDAADRFVFSAEFVAELKQLAPGELSDPQRVLVIIAKGDEVLDWREMHARYARCQVKLLDGGDHALTGFESHLPDITKFLAL